MGLGIQPNEGAYDDLRVVHRDRRFTVARGRSAGRRIVVKSPTGGSTEASAAAALRHEFVVLSRLADAGSAGSGVARAIRLEGTHDKPRLVLDDAGGGTLADKRFPMDVTHALELGLALAKGLGRVHAAGIIHRNVTPSNIVLDDAGNPTLVDFRVASDPQVDPSTLPVEFAESLSYIAPEQTGRMNRGVDNRSDLYALGAILYEVLTGAPPFRGDDALAILHAHFARTPVPADLVEPRVPRQLGRIVGKLLAKAPEQRYQTARALGVDLSEALRQWRASLEITNFELDTFDLALALPLSEHIWGREHEHAVLTKALDRAGAGKPQMVIVAGAAGIGKSALVHGLRADVEERGGRFLEGKFDLNQANIPYASLVEALSGLVRFVVELPDPAQEPWKTRMRDALGDNARVLTELLPQLGEIIGEPPQLAQVGPLEAQLRVAATVRAFLGVFAVEAHPVVLFLDDLHWADPATIDTLRELLVDRVSQHLVVIGACRPEAVEPHHPLVRLDVEVRALGVEVTKIEVGPLGASHVTEMLAHTFRREPDEIRPFATMVAQKTGGNPFFVRQLLRSLQKSGIVSFDPLCAGWTWDAARMDLVGITDNVADLLAKAIDDLPRPSREVLPVAACEGGVIDPEAIAAVLSLSEPAVVDALEGARREGLLVVATPPPAPTYRFAHDRVQEAARRRLGSRERRQTHLRIGRYLAARFGEHEEHIFEIADQMNPGADLLASAQERYQLARIDARAGDKARAAAAYGSALTYYRTALALLAASTGKHHALSFTLHERAAEVALLTGDHALSAQLVRHALPRAETVLDKAGLYHLLVVGATVRAAWDEAINAAQEGLHELGFDEALSSDLDGAIARERAAVAVSMAGRTPRSLLDAPPMAREQDAAIVRLLVALQHPAWFHDRKLFDFLTARALRFILEHGNAAPALTAYTDWAICLAAEGRFAEAEAFADLAEELARRFGDRAQEAHAAFIRAAFVLPWRKPYAEVIPLIRHSYSMALEGNEVRTAGYALSGLVIAGVAAGRDLDDILRDIDADMPFFLRTRNGPMARFHLAYRQSIRAYKGTTRVRGRFDDDDFDEASYLASVQGEAATRCVYEIRRMQTAYLFRDFVEAALHLDEARQRLAFVAGYLPSVPFNLFSSLTFAALCDGAPEERRAEFIVEIRKNQSQLATWMQSSPTNFRASHRLVEAELARVEARDADATDLYDEAIEAAFARRSPHEEALARELAGRHAHARGRKRIAELQLRESQRAYAVWGANEKVRALDEEFPFLRFGLDGVTGQTEASLDLLGILHAAASLSTEVALDRLLGRLLGVCIEVAGADGAWLLVEEDGAPFVRAKGTASEVATNEHTPLQDVAALPVALIEHVRTTHRPLVVDDASRDVRVSTAPGEHDERPAKSFVIVPIQHKGVLVAELYCENSLVTHAFSPARVNVLELLSAQMASALQNSLLFEKLRAEVRERTRTEHGVRFLAEAGIALSESLDPDATLARLAELAVPRLADWSLIVLVDDAGSARPVAGAHVDPAKRALIDELHAAIRLRATNALRPGARALRARTPLVVDEATDEAFRSFDFDPEVERILRALGTGSALISPLITRGRTLGTMSFVSTATRRYGPFELELTTELSRRAALAIDNARLFKEVEEAVRLRDEFLSIAAHELNTPLTALKLMVQALAREPTRVSVERMTRGLTLAERQIRRLTRLVDELVDVSSIHGGHLALDLAATDLVRVARDTIEQLRDAITQSGSTVGLTAHGSVVGRWDHVRLEQILSNLLSNAIKFGEGRRIEVEVSETEGLGRIVVRDHGAGIPPDRVAHVFERFTRAVPARNFGGLGLGLYIVKAVVTAMGGEVRVESSLGTGSTFTVDLPLDTLSLPTKEKRHV